MMRSVRILLVFSIILFINPLFSQQTQPSVQIKKSTDKVKIEGKTFYIHIVHKGESLYSIAKAYGVSQMEIAMENPDIYLGIQVDQALKIPAKDLPEKGNDVQFIHHIVKKGETLFGISKRYKVSIEDISRINPDVESGLILNQEVLIPKREGVDTTQIVNQNDSTRYIYHQVKPKEGLYSISRLYNIPIQSIEELNKDVIASGLKFGTILKIPKKVETVSVKSTLKVTEQITSKNPKVTQGNNYSTPRVKCDTFNYKASKKIFNISLLLPLLRDVDDLDSAELAQYESGVGINSSSESIKISSKMNNFLDFYQGFLLAVDSVKRDGLSINLSVYNTSKDINESKKLLNEKGIKESDLIIGPVYPELLQPFADFSRVNRINIVSPLSQNDALLKGNPYYFQVNPSIFVQFDEFASKINLCSNQNLIIVYEDDSSSLSVSEKYKGKIKSKLNQCGNPDSVHFKELKYKPGGVSADFQDKLNQSMTDQKENVFIIPSESEAFVSDFLSHLIALTTYYNYKVKVYGFPRWQRFKNVPIDYFYKLNVNLFTPYFVNYNRKDVKRFVDDYRHYYRSEASQYSFQGYDIGLYFLKALKNYGIDFKYCLQNLNVDLLQSNYRFVQSNSVDGFDNQSIYLIRYTQDFDIVQY